MSQKMYRQGDVFLVEVEDAVDLSKAKAIEPDGSFKDYFIRVPPTIRTAHAAVAWSFGMTAEQYHPLKES